MWKEVGDLEWQLIVTVERSGNRNIYIVLTLNAGILPNIIFVLCTTCRWVPKSDNLWGRWHDAAV